MIKGNMVFRIHQLLQILIAEPLGKPPTPIHAQNARELQFNLMFKETDSQGLLTELYLHKQLLHFSFSPPTPKGNK